MKSFYYYLFYLFYCHGIKTKNNPEYYSCSVLALNQMMIVLILIKSAMIFNLLSIERNELIFISYAGFIGLIFTIYLHWKYFIKSKRFVQIVKDFEDIDKNKINNHRRLTIIFGLCLMAAAIFLPTAYQSKEKIELKQSIQLKK